MKSKDVWQLRVRTAAEAEEAVTELLTRLCDASPSSYTNVERGTCVATFFTQKGRTWLKQRVPALKAGLDHISECGLSVKPAAIEIEKVRREDWSESWKKYFKTIRMGRALLIKPSWSKERPLQGQKQIILDPGLSFGTGQHPTTGYCLRELARYRRRAGAFLDAGCGSGILSIAAAKLGYGPVRAFDFDPVAVRVAKANILKNKARVEVTRRDLTRLPDSYASSNQFICANMMAPLLIQEVERLKSRLVPGGTLVLAGILETEFTRLREVYEQAGLRFLRGRTEREWRSGTFVAG
jgi:ribosomal protein L11 methyltransferase